MPIKSQENFTKSLPQEARLLGLDVGEKTIGLALSDVRRTIATPFSTIERKKFSKDVEILKNAIFTQNVGGLIIGLPINLDGSHGKRVQSVQTFVSNLSRHIDLPMLFWDERFSTIIAEKLMIKADMSRKRRKELVDKMAASYILQGYMDSLQKG